MPFRAVTAARLRPALFVCLATLWLGAGHAAAAGGEETVEQSVCRLIEAASRAEGLPTGYLTRLIWKESSFRSHVVSPAGAQGIAQFMPRTANERGLSDPFDPEQAIPKAASYLADLKRQFGNLGLAAAAYNGGPNRVSNWLAGKGELPGETRDYVLTITGLPVSDWRGENGARSAESSAGTLALNCAQTTAALRVRAPNLIAAIAPLAPWGVQLSGNFSKAIALASFNRARTRLASVLKDVEPMIIGTRLRSRGSRPDYRVRAPAQTRAEAGALCARIHAAGGACIVLRS